MNHAGQAFYEGWATQQLADPMRDIVLEWKAVHMASLFRRNFPCTVVHNICEIGEAEGTVIASVGRLLGAKRLDCYELSEEFCRIGRIRQPDVTFVNGTFERCTREYDIALLSDIAEHVEDDDALLDIVRARCKYVLFKMPIELCVAAAEWRYLLQGKHKPPEMKFGEQHYNGHLRGYSEESALLFIERHMKIVDRYMVDPSFYYRGGKRFVRLRRWLGLRPFTWLVGGSLFVLARSGD